MSLPGGWLVALFCPEQRRLLIKNADSRFPCQLRGPRAEHWIFPFPISPNVSRPSSLSRGKCFLCSTSARTARDSHGLRPHACTCAPRSGSIFPALLGQGAEGGI